MLDIPDPGKGLFDGINYKWNKEKTIGFTVLILASIADGIVEGYEFDGRKSFERKFGVDPISYAGSQSWLLAYKNHDVNQGFKSKYREWAGSPDLYHHLDDIRKFGYIGGGISLGIGIKGQNWKAIVIDMLIGAVVTSASKSMAMKWVRN